MCQTLSWFECMILLNLEQLFETQYYHFYFPLRMKQFSWGYTVGDCGLGLERSDSRMWAPNHHITLSSLLLNSALERMDLKCGEYRSPRHVWVHKSTLEIDKWKLSTDGAKLFREGVHSKNGSEPNMEPAPTALKGLLRSVRWKENHESVEGRVLRREKSAPVETPPSSRLRTAGWSLDSSLRPWWTSRGRLGTETRRHGPRNEWEVRMWWEQVLKDRWVTNQQRIMLNLQRDIRRCVVILSFGDKGQKKLAYVWSLWRRSHENGRGNTREKQRPVGD
jgi:hypothetical protein